MCLLTINANKSIYFDDDLPQLNYHSLRNCLSLYRSKFVFPLLDVCIQFHRTDRNRLIIIAIAGGATTASHCPSVRPSVHPCNKTHGRPHPALHSACIIQVTGTELFGDNDPPPPTGDDDDDDVNVHTSMDFDTPPKHSHVSNDTGKGPMQLIRHLVTKAFPDNSHTRVVHEQVPSFGTETFFTCCSRSLNDRCPFCFADRLQMEKLKL